MKFSLFYEMYVPDGDETAEARIVRDTVAQIIHADRHGWDCVWMAEHHFLHGFSHMSAPDIVFAAAAYQTQRIRFGFGLALTPPSYNHPVRIAERVAMLDCLSNGRVELGTGRSTTPAELYGFGIDPEQSRAQWDEGFRAVVRLLAETDVALDGEFVSMPARTTYPRPVQKPHPPLWVGGVGPGNAERAAKQGLGMLFFAHKAEPKALEESIAAYKAAIGDAATPYGAINNQTAGFVNGLCGRDREAVRKLAARKTVEHTYHGTRHMLTGWPDDRIPPSYGHLAAGETRQLYEGIRDAPEMVADFFLDNGFVMAGDIDDCRTVVKAFHEAGVDQLVIHMQMGDVPHEAIMESIEIIGETIIPEFK